jgi:hypothetical protein
MLPPMPDRLPTDRYRVDALISRGGEGALYSATDLLTGERLAIKCLFQAIPPEHHAGWQRLLATLLGRSVPGVVDLLDAELAGQRPYLVMRFVSGEPWPGEDTPRTWAALQRPARRLLRSLLGLHRIGLAHGDLKPENAHVLRDGEVVLVDLGATPVQTEGYTAPEGPDEGELGSADLYAVGAMLFEALTGTLPGPTARPCPADTPEHIVRLIHELLQPDPLHRPASVEAVLERLSRPDWSEPHVRALLPARIDSPADLQCLFTGHEPVWHGPSDAAAILWELTHGAPDRILEELRAWDAADHVCWSPDLQRFEVPATRDLRRRVRLTLPPRRPVCLPSFEQQLLLDIVAVTWPHATPTLLAEAAPDEAARHLPNLLRKGGLIALPDGTLRPVWRNDPPLPAAEGDLDLYPLLASSLSPAHPARLGVLLAVQDVEAGAQALRVAAQALATGDLLTALEVPLTTLHASLPLKAETRVALARAAALAALADDRAESLSRALRACAVPGRATALPGLVDLLAACLELSPGHGGRRGHRALLTVLDALAPFADPDLELHRQAARAIAAAALPAEERQRVRADLATLCARLPRPDLQARARRALQLLDVIDGRTAAPDPDPSAPALSALRAHVLAAAAALDAREHDHCQQHLDAALQIAQTVRHPETEALALTIARMVRYRRDPTGGPDLALLAAVAPLDDLNARLPVAIVEGAFAWRSGDLPLAAALASQVTAELGIAHVGAALALGLARWCAPGDPSFDHATALRAATSDRQAPAVAAQALAMLAAAGLDGPVREALQARLQRVHSAGAEAWEGRREVLSMAECAWILEQDGPVPADGVIGAVGWEEAMVGT